MAAGALASLCSCMFGADAGAPALRRSKSKRLCVRASELNNHRRTRLGVLRTVRISPGSAETGLLHNTATWIGWSKNLQRRSI